MKIIFIGAGNMASALIGGLIKNGIGAMSILAIDPSEQTRSACQKLHGVNVSANLNEIVVSDVDVVVLAIKPQLLKAVASGLADQVGQALVISVAAGVRLADISNWLGNHRRVVRAMPNTPAQIGHGMTGLAAMDGVGSVDKALADKILCSVGKTVWVSDDAGLDVVTAVSGSGPAYVFYFIEALQKAGQDLGLTPDEARILAVSTFSGASLLAATSEESPTMLREKVTSKGGTTAAAIDAFNDRDLAAGIRSGVSAAYKRAVVLGDELGA